MFKTWLKIIKEVDIYKNSSLRSGRLVKIFQRLEKKRTNYCFILDFFFFFKFYLFIFLLVRH